MKKKTNLSDDRREDVINFFKSCPGKWFSVHEICYGVGLTSKNAESIIMSLEQEEVIESMELVHVIVRRRYKLKS